MPKKSIINPRTQVVSLIRHASLELSNLANEVEQLGDIGKLEKSLQSSPNLIEIFRKATWELQNSRLDKVSDLLSEAKDEVANEQLAAVSTN
ncbi:hypothetical protein [Nostoc sp. TCL26-01]|uniref:hypothetical protein n=1 Tax=Nostoc sp. TCL26-01 TaxID=2576904 RepID=UPI0015BDB09E|nr:hypothetical protein [Nostoc sp. TCL26-01]QLE54830.1 hypothetical protein FD725_04450 [Nostoc sp. TCL26-01]QLE58758.1 hypothetical protein FD725_26595 [Nostoc sp. TCL26-01]